MDKTKEAVRGFMSKAGHHDTTVHEQVAPAVTHETVKPVQHEEVVTAVDKEVHQDHYHHKVQPVHDKEVLPEQHKHQVGGVVNREFDHRDHDTTERTLREQQAKLRDERVVHETKHTQSRAPVIEGEHVHHHVHETIQPVIQKEVIQPEVIHTTVPVHEVHHKEAQHHGTTTLPPVNINEFKQHSHQSHTKAFDGCPDGVHSQGCPEGSHPGHTSGNRTGNLTGNQHNTGSQHNTGALGSTDRSSHGTTGSHITGEGREGAGHGLGGTSNTSHTGTHTDGTHKKPSLLDRLNPMKDTDHDGKKGVME